MSMVSKTIHKTHPSSGSSTSFSLYDFFLCVFKYFFVRPVLEKHMQRHQYRQKHSKTEISKYSAGAFLGSHWDRTRTLPCTVAPHYTRANDWG